MEKSLLFQTNMLLHVWLLSISENVSLLPSYGGHLFFLCFAKNGTVKMSCHSLEGLGLLWNLTYLVAL